MGKMPQTTGRPRGSQSKNSQFLLKRLQDMYGADFDPVMRMAENVVKLEEAAKEEPSVDGYNSCIAGWDKVARYVCPTLKAIEISGDANRPLVIIKDLTGTKRET